jgi:16S rRNA (guanine527-N7)-methyltransferase
MNKIEIYKDELLKWNKKINLLSRKLDENDLDKHIHDCQQLGEIIGDKASIIFDIGSGSGLPGIILIASGFKNTHLVEISSKKCVFLANVIALLGMGGKVQNADINTLKTDSIPHIIVSKAYADISTILQQCERFITPEIRLILPKSQEQEVEIEEAEKKWKFELQKYQSKVYSGGVIFEIKNIRKQQW